LLRQERVAQVGRPLNVVRQPLHDLWESGQRLDGGVPVLLHHGVRQRLVFQVGVLTEELLQLDDFQRVGRRGEHLSEERVGIKGDGCHQGVQLIWRNFWSLLSGAGLLLRLARKQGRIPKCDQGHA
jgi:hypothetical protein